VSGDDDAEGEETYGSRGRFEVPGGATGIGARRSSPAKRAVQTAESPSPPCGEGLPGIRSLGTVLRLERAVPASQTEPPVMNGNPERTQQS